MFRVVGAATLLAISTTCAGAEPPPPLPPQTGVDPAVPVQQRPALPTFDSSGANPETPPTRALTEPVPQVATDASATPWFVPVDSGVWYRPEAVVPGTNAGLHVRHPYYSYRRPWYPAGPASLNVTIIW